MNNPLLKLREKSEERYWLVLYSVISAALALVVMLFVYFCHGNTLTFGGNTVLRMDLYHQYGPLYAELYDRIVNGYSLAYSWTSGLGGAFLGNLFNYCCSPFALVILLVGHQNMPEAIAIMILLKAMLASAAFTYYINKSSGKLSRISIGFGLLYAFSGYFVAYSWNIMWLDAMAVFPLVILGIEKIIRKNKPSLYIFALTYTMITNYYMAYMVCILSVLWFLFYYFSQYELYSPVIPKTKEVPVPPIFAPTYTEDGFEVIGGRPAQPAFERAPENAPSLSAADSITEAFVQDAQKAEDIPTELLEVTPADAPQDTPASADTPTEPSGETVTQAPSADAAAPLHTFVTEPLPENTQTAPAGPAPGDPMDGAPAPGPAAPFGTAYTEPAGQPLSDGVDPSGKTRGSARRKKEKTKEDAKPKSSWFLLADFLCLIVACGLLLYYVAMRATGKAWLLAAIPAMIGLFVVLEASTIKRVFLTFTKRAATSRFFLTGVTFALSSGLCFLLAAFALLPVYYCLKTCSATGNPFPTSFKVYFNLFDFVANHLPSLTTTIRSSGDIVLPNVYCGLATVMLLPLFFFSKRVTGRKKLAAIVLLGVFYISFSNNYFNYVWHGMHMPNDLPFRYSFAYSFLLLAIAYEVLKNIGEFSNRVYVGVGVGTIAFTVLLDELTSQNVQTKTIMMTLIFAVVYVVFLGMLRSKRFERNAVLSLLIIAFITEICVGDTSNFVMQQPKENYVSDYTSYQEIRRAVESKDDDLFYRTELSRLRARMDPCWYGYNGVSTFSSMAYEHVAKLMEDLGMFGNDINSYTYNPQTPIFNSMFALKYIYDNNSLISENRFYEKKAQNDDFTAYEYKYALPLAFAVDERISEWSRDLADPFLVQNDLMEKATGVADILTQADVTDVAFDNIVEDADPAVINVLSSFTVSKDNYNNDGNFTAIIDVEEEGQYYIYTGSTNVNTISVTAENYSYSYSSSSSQPLTLDLGQQPAGAQIRIIYTLTEDNEATIDFSAVRIDAAKFERAYKKLQSNGTLALDSFEETSLSGTVTVAGDDKVLYTSIPYDESWNVYVDGDYVSYGSEDIVKIGDALLGVKLSAGTHTVTLRYRPRGLSTGMKLTGLGMMIVALMLVWKYYLSDILRKKNIRIPLFETGDMWVE